VDYLAEGDAGKPPSQRGSYRAIEDTMTLVGERKADPVLRVRRVLVWSSARAGAAATARARKLDPAQVDAAEVLARYQGQEVVERRYGGSRGRWRSRPCWCRPPGAARPW
jgi:hypothetical protein